MIALLQLAYWLPVIQDYLSACTAQNYLLKNLVFAMQMVCYNHYTFSLPDALDYINMAYMNM